MATTSGWMSHKRRRYGGGNPYTAKAVHWPVPEVRRVLDIAQ